MVIKGYDIDAVNALIAEFKNVREDILHRHQKMEEIQNNLFDGSVPIIRDYNYASYWFKETDSCIEETLKRLEHVKQQNASNTPRFEEFCTIPDDVREFSSLVTRYSTHLLSATGMLGYPGGGWKNIALSEKTDLASVRGNKPALFSLLANQMGAEGSISEDQMSRIIELSIMNPDEKKAEMDELGGEAKFIEKYFGNDASAEARYKLSEMLHSFIDKEVNVKYGDLKKNPSELKRRYKSFGFSEVQYNDLMARSGASGVYDAFRQVEASKLLGVLLYSRQDIAQYKDDKDKQIKGHHMTALYDTSSYNIYSGVSVRVFGNVKPVEEHKTPTYTGYGGGGMVTFFVPEKVRTVQILRAQNTIIRLPDVLSQYQGTSGQKVEVTKSSVNEVNLFNATLSTAQIDKDLNDAKQKLDAWSVEAGGEIASFVISLVPGGSIGIDKAKELFTEIAKDVVEKGLTKSDDFYREVAKEYKMRKDKSLPEVPQFEELYSEKYKSDFGRKEIPNKLQDGAVKGFILFNKKSELEAALESRKKRKEDDTKINDVVANDGYVIIENGKVNAYSPDGSKK